MVKLSIILLLLVSFKVNANSLRVGDILLQPLSCWSCSLIEAQEGSEFSHIGVYIGEGKVLEALGSVRVISLKDFVKRTKKGSKVLVRRPYKLIDKENFLLKANSFIGFPYDKTFSWNNFIDDKEALYCSELVYKLFYDLIPLKNTVPKRMPFDINPLAWDRYFNNETPRGDLGVSPEDFNKSVDFYTVLEL